MLKLVGESSCVASGVRRVEAVTGDGVARALFRRDAEVSKVATPRLRGEASAQALMARIVVDG